MPHRSINYKVPYEILYNSEVDYNRFKIFGCKVFFHIPKQFRKKYENSTLPGIFIGYADNPTAYKIYDINNNKIVYSRSIIFFEDSPGNASAPPSPSEFINLIPYSESGGSDSDNSFEINDNKIIIILITLTTII